MARRFDVLNLGLPRSGTTSFAACAMQKGLRSHASVATWLQGDRWALDTFDRHTLPEGPRRVATLRDPGNWLESAARYSRLDEVYLADVLMCWLDWVEQQHDVEFIDIADPPPEWRPFPHLNASGPILPPPTAEQREKVRNALDDMLIEAGGGLP